jgi:hypothetical protein
MADVIFSSSCGSYNHAVVQILIVMQACALKRWTGLSLSPTLVHGCQLTVDGLVAHQQWAFEICGDSATSAMAQLAMSRGEQHDITMVIDS